MKGVRRVSGMTLVLSGEDEVQDTILPRLAAARGNFEYIDMFRCLDSYLPDYKSFSLKSDLDVLVDAIKEVDAQLVILDPITAFMEGIDPNNSAAVRRYLTPLAHAAAYTGVAILAITHLNKKKRQADICRATGSLALAAMARAVHLVTTGGPAQGPGLNDVTGCGGKGASEYCLFTPIKSNLTSRLEPLAYRIVNGRVEWAKTGDEWAADIGHSGDAEERTEAAFYKKWERESAEDFLRKSLAGGPRAAAGLIKEAKSVAISEWSLRQAKARMGVVSDKEGWKEWYWRMAN